MLPPTFLARRKMLPPAFLASLPRTAVSCAAVLVLSTVTTFAVPAPQARDVLAADRADASLGLATSDWRTQDLPEEKKFPVFISSSADAHDRVQEDRPINLHDAFRREKMFPRGKTAQLDQVGDAVPSHAELSASQEKIQLKQELGKMLADFRKKMSELFIPETQNLEVAGDEMQRELLHLGDDILGNMHKMVATVPETLEQKSIVKGAVVSFSRALRTLSDRVQRASESVILSLKKFLQRDFSPRGFRRGMKRFGGKAMQKLRSLRSRLRLKRQKKAGDLEGTDVQVGASM